MDNLPVMDAHIHLDPEGDPRGAVRRFLEAGGTHLIIVHKPYSRDPTMDLEGYERAYRTTIGMKDLSEKIGVKAWCVLGPYPGELPRQCEALGLDEAFELQASAVGLAMDWIGSDGVIGIGEVGRVHFPIGKEVQDLCDKVMSLAMEASARKKGSVVLHTETLVSNPGLMDHLADLCDKAGLKKERAIKHYSDPGTVRSALGKGLSASMLCRKESLKELLVEGIYPLLETDFIDDRNRPDLVMPPDTVPKKLHWAKSSGILNEAGHWELMVKAPLIAFGVSTIERS